MTIKHITAAVLATSISLPSYAADESFGAYIDSVTHLYEDEDITWYLDCVIANLDKPRTEETAKALFGACHMKAAQRFLKRTYRTNKEGK